MAKDEKLPQKTPAKKPAGNKFVRIVTALPKRMWRAILNTVAELKKVTWPGRKALVRYTAVVISFMVLMAVVVGVLDLGASELISLIIR